MKRTYISIFALLLCSSIKVYSLPQGEQVVAGQAEFVSDSQTMSITTSDKAIINYQAFNISESEHVQFIQPSSKSTVLNRVIGKNPTQIFGKLSANGKVFLVNGNGIYFGPNSTVNAGSFVASTLNIRDSDFLNNSYKFFLEKGSENSTIINEGKISSSAEGFIALVAPFIENRGSIYAQVGKIVLASSEKLTLDFTGDGLVQFAVDGELENALIENYGEIAALNGSVDLSVHTARNAIKMVVNTEGIKPANSIEQSNGIIRLVNKSQISGKKVKVEAEKLEISGKINVANDQGIGGEIIFLGDQVQVQESLMDASGKFGGGTILIGGDYQGSNGIRTATNSVVDKSTLIFADAHDEGNGGKVIVWADETTLFDGKIYARGGLSKGNGGFVETSGKMNLGIQEGYVNTLAPLGKAGDWLLDPNNVTIAGAGGDSIASASAPNCGNNSNRNISVSTLNAAASNVSLCSQNLTTSTITINSAISMTNAGVGITFTAGSTNVGPININANITTRGGALNFVGNSVIGANVTLNTTNATAAGADINFSGTINGSGARTLTLTSGTSGVVTFGGAVGATTALTSLAASGATINQNSTIRTTGTVSYTGSSAINVSGNITTNAAAITMSGPVIVSSNPTLDTTNAGALTGADVSFSSTVDGATNLTLRTGTAGNVIFTGAVGGTTPLTDLEFTSAAGIQISNNITVSGANPLNFISPVTLNGGSTITSNNAAISFDSTINGAQNLAVNSGTSTTTFVGAVGGTTPLTSLQATGSQIIQTSTVRTTGSVTYTGSSLIDIRGNITTSGGIITFTGPVSLTNAPTFDTTNGGTTATGANINFSNTVNGATSLTLRAGTAGNILFSGAVGGTTPLTNLTFTSANLVQIGNNIRVSGANPLVFSVPVSLTGTSVITSNNANVTFSSTLNGNNALTVAAGTGTTTFSSAVGGTTPLASLTVTSATITPSSTIQTVGAVSLTATTVINLGNNITTAGGAVTLSGPVTLTGTPTINTSNGVAAGANISFIGAVNGAAPLTLNAGTGGIISFSSTVGATTPPTNLVFTNASLIQIGNNITVSGANPLSFPFPVALTGGSTITSNNANVSFGSTLNGNQALIVAAGTGTITFTGAIGNTTPLSTLSASGSTITQSSSAQVNGAISYTAGTAINLGGNITTNGGVVTLTGPVNLTGGVTVNTSNATPAGANITFTSTINGAQPLTLNGGTGGTISFGAVGGTTPLNSITTSGAIITQNSTVKTTGVISYTGSSAINLGGNLTTSAGAMSFSGPVNLNADVALDTTNLTGSPTGANITFSSSINGARNLNLNGGTSGTVSFGAVGGTNSLTSLTAAGATINQNSTVKTTGNVNYTAGTSININGNITTSGGVVTVGGPATLTANTTIDTTNSGAVPAGGSVTFSGSLNGNSANTRNLTINAGTAGNINFSGSVGNLNALNALTITNVANWTANAITSSSITQSNGTGTTTFNGAINTNGAAGIVLTGNNFNLNSSITTTNNGPLSITHSGTLTFSSSANLNISGQFSDNGTGSTVLAGSITTNGQDITFSRPATLGGPFSVSTGPGVGNIAFSSTVDGAQNLTLNAGGGNITFSSAVGSLTRLGTLTITNANNVTANALTLASFNQVAGTGVTTFNGAVNLNNASGLSIVTANTTFNNTLQTTNGGPANIQVSGTLLIPSAAVFTLDGGFAQTGTGSVQSAASITTTNDAIQFTGPVVLLGLTTLNTGATGANITFSDVVNGPGGLNLTAGTGSINFSGSVGSTTRIGVLTINNASSVSTGSITAASINQIATTGTSTYGAINTNAIAGVQLVGNIFSISGNLITTNAGPFVITNAGQLSLNAGASTQIAGNFTQNGAGNVNLQGTVAAPSISFLRPITLTNATTLNSGLGSGSITLSNTVDGSATLNVIADSGTITFSNSVGATTPLTSVTFTSAQNISTQSISAGSITQVAGSGNTTFSGALSTSSASGINLTGSAFAINGNVTTTGNGPLNINNSGTLTMPNTNVSTISGAFAQSGSGTSSLANQITSGGNLSFAGPITLSGATSLSTEAASANITLAGSVNGGNNLTLASGGGDITISGNIGGTNRIGVLTISSARNFSTLDITAQSISQVAGTGTTSLIGNINTNGASGITLVGNNITRSGAVNTTNGGPMVITNSGQLTVTSTASTLLDGLYLQNGSGPVSFAGTMATNNKNITFSSAITLTGNAILNSGSGSGNVTLNGSVNGAQNLTITAGTGNISLNGNIGLVTPLNVVTFVSAADVNTQSISASSIVQSAGSGTSIFNGSLSTSNVAGISLTGTNFRFLNSISTSSGGPFTVTNGGLAEFITGASLNLTGAFTQNGTQNVSLGVNVTTDNDPITFNGPITLTDNVIFNSGSGTSNITISNTINGTFSLTATSGLGNVIFGGTIGQTTPLSTLTASGNNINIGNIGGVSSGVNGATNLSATLNINTLGTTYNAHALTFNANLINFNAGVLTTLSSNGANISLLANSIQLSSGNNLTLNSTNGNISISTIHAPANNLRTLTINAGTGTVTTNVIGAANNGEFATLSITSGDMHLQDAIFANTINFSSTAGHTQFLGGSITTQNALTFPIPVIRNTNDNITITTQNANVTFASTIDGDVADTRNLNFDVGTGDISLQDTVGGTNPLASLNILTVKNLTASEINVQNLQQNAGTGISTFNGPILVDSSSGIHLTGTAFTFNDDVTVTNGGSFIIANSGLSRFTSAAAVSIDQIINIGTGSIELANPISAGDEIIFNGVVTLAGNTSVSTTAANKLIRFAQTVNGGFNLTISASTSDVVFSSAVGGITRLGALNVSNSGLVTTNGITASSINLTSTGSLSFGNLNTNGILGISLNGSTITPNGTITTTNDGPLNITNSGTFQSTNSINVDGAFTQNGTGPVFFSGALTAAEGITYNSAITLLGNASFSSTNNDILFGSTIDGAFGLTLSPGIGDISFNGNIGGTNPIGILTITGGTNVDSQAITAQSFTQSGGLGLTTLNGAVITTNSTGFTFTGNALTLGTSLQTQSAGPVTITNNGLFTSNVPITADGDFTQNTGDVSLGNSLTSSTGNVSFSGAVTLIGATNIQAGLVDKNISFQSTIDGGFSLTLNSHSGNIILSDNVGDLTRIGQLTFTNADAITTQDIRASQISQLAGSGITTFNGDLNTNAAGGISLIGKDFNINGSVTTTNAGPLVVTNSGALAMSPGAISNISGPLTINGSGTTALSNSMTVGDDVIITENVTIPTFASITTTAQPISFLGFVDGPGDLTLQLGAEDLLFTKAIGSSTRLGDLTINSARNVTTTTITADSLTQLAGTGLSSFDDINLAGVEGAHLAGTNFTVSDIVTANLGPIEINNSGTLTIRPSSLISSDGSFSQVGAGAVNVSGLVQTNNSNLLFTGPITLTGDLTLNSGSGAGNVTILNTIDGNYALTITVGSGDLLVNAALGSVTPLGPVVVNSANNVTVKSVTALSISQLSGTGTSLLNGNFTTTGAGGILMIGNNFTRNGAIVVGGGGSLVVTNSGLLTGLSINTTSIGNAYIQNGTGPVNFAGSVAAPGGISFTGPVTLVATTILDTSGGSSNITFSNTVNGNKDLTLIANQGNITFSNTVGSTTPLGNVTAGSAKNVTMGSFSATSLTGSNIGGTEIFAPLTLTGPLSLNGNAFIFNNDVSVNGATISNTGLLSIVNGITFTSTGGFSQNGPGSTSLNGSIVTTNAPITFAKPIVLAGNSSLSTGVGAGDITLSDAVDGAFSLTLTAGSGNINVSKSVGSSTPLTALAIPNANDINFATSITLNGPFTISSSSGNAFFTGAVTTRGTSITGTNITLNNIFTTTNGGSINITNSGTLVIASLINSANAFTQTGLGTVALQANINTFGLLQFDSAMTLGSAVTLNSHGGNIVLSNTVNGGFDMTLTADTGNINLGGNIGSAVGGRLGAFTITKANNIDAQSITAASLNLMQGTGTSTLHGGFNTNTPGGITLVGNNFITSGQITTTGGGPLVVTNSGLITGTAASNINVDGPFTQNGTGPVNVGGTMVAKGNILHKSVVNVLIPATFTSTNNDIIFESVVNGPACLTLVAGNGNIRTLAPMGNGTALGCYTASASSIFQPASIRSTGAVIETVQPAGTLQLGNNITTLNGTSGVTINGNVILTSNSTISTNSGTGNVAINGTINGNLAGNSLTVLTAGNITLAGSIGVGVPLRDITLTGNNISWNNLDANGSGATGSVTLTATTDINFTGTTYSGATSVGASQSYTAGNNFNFNSASTTITTNNTPVTFNTGTMQLAGGDLTINTNGGNVTLSPLLLGTNRNFTVDADEGNFTYTQIGQAGDELNVVTLTATPTPSAANIYANTVIVGSTTPTVLSGAQGVIMVPTTFNSPLIIDGLVTFETSGTGSINFTKRIDADTNGGSMEIDLSANSGSVVFAGPVGGINPLSSITLTGAGDVNVNSTFAVGSYTEIGGTGTTSIESGMTTTNTGGIQIESNNINLTGTFVTGTDGPIILDNTGTLDATLTSFDVGGNFQQIGTGTVFLGQTIMTHGGTASFSGPITLTGDLILLAGNITFTNTIDGQFNISFEGDDITLSGVAGGTAPLNNFVVNTAENVLLNEIHAASVSVNASGSIQVTGPIVTTTNTGIVLTGTTISVQNMQTDMQGPVVINNSQLFTLSGDVFIAGPFIQSGIGSSELQGQIFTLDHIEFATPVALTGDTFFDTSTTSQNITFASTLDGPGNAFLAAGFGSISIGGDVGSTTPLGSLHIVNAMDVFAGSIVADSLQQDDGTGTTTIIGDITTTGALGIQLTGTNFTIDGVITTTNAGPVVLQNNGILTLSAHPGSSISDIFFQTTFQDIRLGGTISAYDFTFSGPVTLMDPTNLTAEQGIFFSNPINGNQPLTLTANLGDISFAAPLGNSEPLGAITVNNVQNITYPFVDASSLTQLNATGITTMIGPINARLIEGISIKGDTINQDGIIITSALGPIIIDNSDLLTITNGVFTSSAGGFLQIGTGLVNLGGSIMTDNQLISFNSAVILTNDVEMNTGTAAGNINFLSSIDGAFNLQLVAGAGDIYLGNVGNTTPLNDFTIVSAADVTIESLHANSITQQSGEGTTIFNGPVEATGVNGIVLSGNGFTFNNTVDVSAGSISISNTGNFTLTSNAAFNVAGFLNQTNLGNVNLSGTITTGDDISFTGPVNVSGTASLNSSSNPISFINTVNGPGNLTLNSGTDDITFTLSAGALLRIGNLTITSADDVTFKDTLNAFTITQTAGTGTSLFQKAVFVNGPSGINLTGNVFTFENGVTTVNGGSITINNAGLLTTRSNRVISSSGAFNQTGSGSVSLGGTIQTNNANISFASPITLNSASTLNTGTSAGSILIGQTISGNNNNLNLTAALGDINFSGNASALGILTINSAKDVTLQAVSALEISQIAGSGTTTFNGPLNTTGALGIRLTGNNFTRNSSVSTSNGGPLIITNSGQLLTTVATTVTLDGRYVQNGTGPVSTQGTIITNGIISFTGPVTLLGNTTWNSSPSNGAFSSASTIDGAFNLTINSGAGTATLSQPVGATTALNSLTISGRGLTIGNIGAASPGVLGTTAITSTSSITFTGTTYNTNLQNINAATTHLMTASAPTTFQSNGANINFSSAPIRLSPNTNLSLISSGGSINTGNVSADAGSLRTLVMNAGAGSIQIGSIGAGNGAQFAASTLTGNNITTSGDVMSNALTLNYTGIFTTSGNIATINNPISFPNSVVIQANSLISTGNGNLTFSGTVNGNINFSNNLTLDAGSGVITLTQPVGATRPLNNFQVSSGTITANAISSNSIIQLAGSGTFNGNLTLNGSNGLQLTGSNFTLNGNVNTSNAGPVTINQSGNLNISSAITTSGGFAQTGSGITAFSGSITSNLPVSFAGPVNISGTPSINTASDSKDISFANTLDGAANLTLTANGGNITLAQNAGGNTRLGTFTVASSNTFQAQAINANSLNITASSPSTVNGNLNTNGASGITFAVNSLILNGSLATTGGGNVVITNSGELSHNSLLTSTIGGSYTQNGVGSVNLRGGITANSNISFSGAMTLSGATTLSSTTGNVAISNKINGAQNLSLGAAGNVSITNKIGDIVELTNLTITSANNVTLPETKVGSFVQTAGNGTTTFTADFTTSATGGIQVAGTNFVRGANITTTGSGPIVINNSGLFTSTASGIVSSASSFAQTNAAGSTTISGTVNTLNSNLSFSGPLNLVGATTLDSGAGSGSITLNTIDGSQTMNLNAGVGNINVQGNVGSGTRLGDLTVSSANDANFQALTASAFVQSAGTGTTTLNGPTDINTSTGLQITATNVNLNGNVNVSNLGFVKLANSGTLNMAAQVVVDGQFGQTSATGTNVLSGSINTQGNVFFTGPTSTTGSPTITANNQPITFISSLDGPGNLAVSSGTNDVMFQSSIGNNTAFGVLTIVNANNVSMNDISANSLIQANGTGTTTIDGNVNTTGNNGVSLTGNIIFLDGSIITTNNGPVSVSHSDLFTLQAGPSTSISGTFVENGLGLVSLLGDVIAQSNISFANPITLIGAAELNSNAGNLLVSNTIDGPYDFVLEGNTISLNGTIGGTTALNAITVNRAIDFTTQAISSGSITQLEGSGTTTFNDTVNTFSSDGIDLTGNVFNLNAPIETFFSGSLTVNNSGLLSISAPLTIDGSFSQIGSGQVNLGGNITSNATNTILFSSPVVLTQNETLNSAGDIIFLDTVDGSFDLILIAGAGDIVFSNDVGFITPLNSLQVTQTNNFNAQGIEAGFLNLANIAFTTTFDGSITTTDPLGIVLSGTDFVFQDSITTLNGGPFIVTNTGDVIFGPNFSMTIDGPIDFNGTGTVFGQGAWTTNNQNVSLDSPLILTDQLTINSGSGSVIFTNSVNGPFNLTVNAVGGDVSFQQSISQDNPLNQIVITAENINLAGIGDSGDEFSGQVILTASDAINLTNAFYTADSQTYNAPNINFNAGFLMTLTSNGPIALNGLVTLSDGSDLSIITNNGNLTYTEITGTSFENITINTGTGTAFLNTISGPGTINNIFVNAGEILFVGPITGVNMDFESLGGISNFAGPVQITSDNSVTFNALNGNVGSLTNPIFVVTNNRIFAGAGPEGALANFIGSSIDNTVNVVESNPPCIIIFNGIKIKDCHINPSVLGAAGVFGVFYPGAESSWFSLGDDYFFQPDFITLDYVYRNIPVYMSSFDFEW